MIIRKLRRDIRCLATYVWWKSLMERCLAFLILAVTSPWLMIIALANAIDSPGNPIFRQERVGKNGRIFVLYKFRSMYKDHDDIKYQAYIKKYVEENLTSVFDENGRDIYELIHDPRVTRLGALLRRTNLDELPQLINVLKGEMSFVGPRPDIPFAVKLYREHHKKRLLVTPGITGLWQVLPNRRYISFDEVVKTDLDYIQRQSLFLDTKIIFLTFYQMFVFRSHVQKVAEIKVTEEMKI